MLGARKAGLRPYRASQAEKWEQLGVRDRIQDQHSLR